jgi:hypothetical protein
MVKHNCNPSTKEAETASLNYIGIECQKVKKEGSMERKEGRNEGEIKGREGRKEEKEERRRERKKLTDYHARNR